MDQNLKPLSAYTMSISINIRFGQKRRNFYLRIFLPTRYRCIFFLKGSTEILFSFRQFDINSIFLQEESLLKPIHTLPYRELQLLENMLCLHLQPDRLPILLPDALAVPALVPDATDEEGVVAGVHLAVGGLLREALSALA